MKHAYDHESAADLSSPMNRRSALRFLAGAGVITLVGCSSAKRAASSANATTSTTSTSTTTTIAAATSSSPIPEETAGPYPGDGSNGPNVLTQDGIVRRDITSSFGSSSGTAEGIPTTVKLRLLDTSSGAAALEGAAVYLWHCDREGRYSLYSNGVTGENYLRGVQEAGADGVVTFTTIFPACYSGRWPHMHFEVYSSLDEATSAGQKLATSQIALPAAVCSTAFATAGYEDSVQNFAQVSLTSDNVFGDDGGVRELATVSGDVNAGYVVNLTVPV